MRTYRDRPQSAGSAARGGLAGRPRHADASGRWLLVAAWLVLGLANGVAAEPHPVVSTGRLTPQEAADPLEPWSLEPPGMALPPSPPPVVPPPAVPPPDVRPPAPDVGRQPAPAESTAAAPQVPDSRPGTADESERVLVVRCRQLLVSQPHQAALLAELLRAGRSLEDAERALGHVDIVDRTRDYALDELQPDIRAEVEDLPAGGWSSLRTWRGRSALFQVVSKEERARGSLPALGAGLGTDEQERLAALRRPTPPRPARQQESEDDARNLQKAAVVQQETPAYPRSATISGEVTVEVQVGLTDNVVDVRIVQTSDPVFEAAARDAAIRSAYRSARRNGVPEPGTVTLTFRFVGPPQLPSDQR